MGEESRDSITAKTRATCNLRVSGMAGVEWKNEEIRVLLTVWGEDRIQHTIKGCKRNKLVYVKIAAEMAELGWERTWEQCRTKVKNIVSRYRKVGTRN